MSWEIITWFWHAYIYIPMLIKNFYWGWMYDIPPLCLILAKVTVHCKIIVSQHPFWWKIIDTRHKPGHTIIVILYIEVIIYNYIIFCFINKHVLNIALMAVSKWISLAAEHVEKLRKKGGINLMRYRSLTLCLHRVTWRLLWLGCWNIVYRKSHDFWPG